MMTEHSWQADLERDGFVHLPGAIDADVAARLAMLSLRSLDEYTASEDLVRTGEGVPVKLLYPLGKYPEFLAALGSREIRDVVDALLPRNDSVLTWEDVLVKPPSVGVEVAVHQDIGLDPTRETVHSLGISLTGDRDNPVHFLPGSHRLGPLTKATVEALWRDCREEFRPVGTEAGDVVIHNVHVLHYSEANRSARPRATWYLEFRSLRSLLEKGPWSRDSAERRRAIWVHARASNGDYVGFNESGPVKERIERLEAGTESLRVPHVTDAVRYEPTSPYNHFSGWGDDWESCRPALGGTHHVTTEGGHAIYPARFHEVLKFHSPGLAPVTDGSGAYHITPDGNPAYPERYLRTFGFYDGLAAVQSAHGWLHIRPNGLALSLERYAWCGNFQEGRCPVRLLDGGYVHITDDGSPAYAERHRYAGDFKDGFAVVQREDGKHSHIDRSGNLLHDGWFVDLDVFHKNFARARDERGWHHVDLSGLPLYERRFSDVEPFYNGQARAEGFDGSLSVINESGENLVDLRGPLRSPLEELSADMVGVWKTQTIRAAVELGIIDSLPASAGEIERRLPLADSAGPRLMRALTELRLTWRDGKGIYHPTTKGSYLRRTHPLSLADAALHWGGDSAAAWSAAGRSLRTGRSSLEKLHRGNFFDWLQGRPDQLQSYHQAMAAYARHDYAAIAGAVNFGVHQHILDAGGGTGELAFALVRAFPNLAATIMDRPEVVGSAAAPTDVAERCGFIAGDLFQKWSVACDAVVLARVLHDWSDDDARSILRRAREVMTSGGILYVIEMVLDDSSSGSGGLLDLNMLVMTGGAERSLEQFRTLLAQAGFELLDVTTTAVISSVIRAKAV